MTKEEIKIISKAIKTAITTDVPEFYFETGLRYGNGRHMLKWDYIFSNVRNELAESSLKIVDCDRGIFKMALVVDENDCLVCSIITEKNLVRVRNKKNKRHYLYSLASVNKGMEAQQKQQSLFDEAADIQMNREEELMQIFGFVPDGYETFIIDDSNRSNPVISIATINEDLEIVKREYIKDEETIQYNLRDNDKLESEEKQAIGLGLTTKAKEMIRPNQNLSIVNKDKDRKTN